MHEVDFQRIVLRSDRDSNSGTGCAGYTLSRRASSATRAPLQFWWFDVVVLGLMRFAAHLRCKGTVFFLFLRVFCEFFWWVCMFLTLF